MAAITLSQAFTDLLTNVRLNIPTLMVGPVGVGKSDVGYQVAAHMRNLLGSYTVILKRASEMDPTDLGVPMPDPVTGKVKTFLPDWLPDETRDGPYGMLFFDELTDAPIGVQAVLNQITLERKVGNYRLPDGWSIVATGNRAIDRAASQKVSRATANRLAVIEIGVDVKSWLNWSSGNGIAPELIAYISHANNQSADLGVKALHCYPTGAGSDAIAFVTPRSLARCSKYFDKALAIRDDQLERLMAQNIGDDSARDIMNFLATYRLLPDLQAIIANPANAPLHREPSVNYLLSVALVSKLTHANLAAIVTYVNRMVPLYRAAFWANAIAKDETFKQTREFIAHAIDQQQNAA